MKCIAVLSVLAALAAAGATRADQPAGSAPNHQPPSYQRQRGGQPQHYDSPQRHGPVAGPPVSAGAFQRPYPFHLDYYKQQYGGSYEPYFGNLYGPPNVVLGAPYAPYGYGPQAYAPPPQWQADAPAAPSATQAIVCPHCHQPIYFAAPPANGEQ